MEEISTYHFEKIFPAAKRIKEPMILISKVAIRINHLAWVAANIGDAHKLCEVFYDPTLKIIGLHPTHLESGSAFTFHLAKENHSRYISCKGFIGGRLYPIVGAQLNEGRIMFRSIWDEKSKMFIINLKQAMNTAPPKLTGKRRGRKPKVKDEDEEID